ncbi:glutathione S-transferase C-terminal-like protein [Epithele typhae]|uniref:glutathione S-transferase C-terminal-like protein n=1 Tax=Epithele typhae TaxID=378194 RepID=UPI002008A82F|nr:glutathione S-transferase C-terminal-like protein [Epithele typhae]KAH9929123.1 glutathione S-transferase C-terminal-like protein [Epithele typhae]
MSKHQYSTATSPSSTPLQLYTAGTPNGRKTHIFLEELKAQYGLTYDVHPISLGKNEQKEPWYLKLNPNGRIPTLVDPNRGGFAVFESAAILLYLEQHYDTTTKFAFDPATRADDWSEMLQWIFFAHGGLGPMQGQAGHFLNAAPEDIPYAKKRYVDETRRLFGVLQLRLAGRDWLAGPARGTYSLADMNAFPWVNGHAFTGVETLDEFPDVKAWTERMKERPAVKSGLQIP